MRRGVVLVLIVVGGLATPLLAFGTNRSVRLHGSWQRAAPVLGLVHSIGGFTASGDSILTRLDGKTLAPTGSRHVDFSPAIADWAYSPDRSRLVLADDHQRLFVVDTRTLRVLSSVRRPAFGDGVLALAWIDGRILFVTSGPDTPQLFVVDPRTRRVLAWVKTLPGPLVAAVPAAHALVLLLDPPSGGIGACVLGIVAADGGIRTVALPGAQCGYDGPDDPSVPSVDHQVVPGLAVDPGGNRAFVTPAGSSVVDVDLATLNASAHVLSPPAAAQPAGLFAPSALAKGAPDGPFRRALWLGNGGLAVWGADFKGWIDPKTGPQFSATPAGLTLVDTRSWTARVVDSQAADLARDGSILVTDGKDGLWVYGADGTLRFHLFTGREVYADVGFGHAIVWPRSGRRYTVVDLATGRIVRTGPASAMPVLLAPSVLP